MKNKPESEDGTERDDDLRPEYDFASMEGGVRGKYAQRFTEGTNVILLEPDVAAAFPTSQAVNDALRLILQVARTAVKKAS